MKCKFDKFKEWDHLVYCFLRFPSARKRFWTKVNSDRSLTLITNLYSDGIENLNNTNVKG